MSLARRFLIAGMMAGALACGSGSPPAVPAEPVRVVIDADTANEIDDLYAIVRALVAPEFRVEGLSSAHWRRSIEPNDTVHQSQALNEKILEALGRRDEIPHPVGADRAMPGPGTPVDSPAARHIIARAQSADPDDKLLVIALGAWTNLASALLLEPSIESRVVFACIDGDYRDGQWGPGLYNWVNDIHAVRTIFASGVEYLHMPAPSVSGKMTMTRREVTARLEGRGGVMDLLLRRWDAHEASRDKDRWIMWDIALVQALLRPELATQVTVGAPIVHDADTVEQHPDNPRRVGVFETIDVRGMRRDFWRALDEAARSPQ